MLNLTYLDLSRAVSRYGSDSDATLFENAGLQALRGAPDVDASALRLSLALLECGVPLDGPTEIKDGPTAGQRVDASPRRLSKWLLARLGDPESISFNRSAGGAPDALRGRRGIVSFLRNGQAPGGHIALIEPATLWQVNAPVSAFVTGDVLFWPLV